MDSSYNFLGFYGHDVHSLHLISMAYLCSQGWMFPVHDPKLDSTGREIPPTLTLTLTLTLEE